MSDPTKNEAFQSALSHILRYEGGYVDHPRDPGGATKFGITRKTLARFRKVSPWWKLPKMAVRQMGRVEAAQIYFKYYWSRIRADELPEALAFTMFDYAVNSGPQRAISELQKIVKTEVDGVIGPKTTSAIEKYCERSSLKALLSQYIENRHSFLRKLKTYPVFGTGWRNR
ncbi:glycoside hydrolase family 108 protein, partial [Maritalea sp.]|uniref:glycoside hydrolase family 108 protein n=1 Tax=Maritalea sp. TaxID=2003361 RepID=UPI003EF78508